MVDFSLFLKNTEKKNGFKHDVVSMTDDDQETSVISPADLRNVPKTWEEALGIENSKPSFLTEKIQVSSLTLFDVNPKKKGIFVFPIPREKPLLMGEVRNIPENATIKRPSMLEIDPGMKIGNAGLLVWRSENSDSINWRGNGILFLKQKKWVSFPIEKNYLNIAEGDYVRGIIGPWWGFLIKAINLGW